MSANIVQKPSEEMEDYWIFESDPQISDKWGNYDIKLSGKWMMFYSWSIMDEKWKEAVEQYRSGKLTGKAMIKIKRQYRKTLRSLMKA